MDVKFVISILVFAQNVKKKFYKPVFKKYSENIISCEIICELGGENKRASCNEEKGKEKQCSCCNKGYKLMKSGSCKKIESSFIAIYNIKNINTPTRIMRQMIGHIHSYPLYLSDIEAYINNKKINVTICNYYFCSQFENTCLIEVKVITNKTLQSMKELFQYFDHLIEIKSKVLSTYSMFEDCYSLRAANLSSFNTTLNCAIIFMFQNCYELTSIDLSNFDTNVRSFQDLFKDNKKFSFVDISSFNIIQAYRLDLFKGVSSNGT